MACARLSAIGSCFCWMLAFWVEKSAEIRCAPKKIRGPTPTMRKPTLIYQRRLCIEERRASADGAATSRVTARQDQLCAVAVTGSLRLTYAGAGKTTHDGEGSRAPGGGAPQGAVPGGLRAGAREPLPDAGRDHPVGADD